MNLETITNRAESYKNKGCTITVVQGLGFVGSAVAASIAAAVDETGQPKHFVIGVDLADQANVWKIEKINAGRTPIESPDPELQRLTEEAVRRGNLIATSAEEVYGLADVIVADVPLSVANRAASCEVISLVMEPFKNAIRTIGRRMRPDCLVLVETTVPVGTCRNIVLPILRQERKSRGISQPLRLAHAYERVMPGPRYVESIRRFWRSFAGLDEASSAAAREFLSSFIETGEFPLAELRTPESTELAKLLENSYRAANIALIHEWTLLAEAAGVNLFEVIEAIRVRKGTHDNIRFPGFGVGGYCLTKDSLLAQWSATNFFGGEVNLSMTLEALRINYNMPLHTLGLAEKLAGGSLKGQKVVVCGVAYLPGVADTRNSPTELFVQELTARGAEPVVHDPCVDRWPEMPQVKLSQDLAQCIAGADGIVFAVPHGEYKNFSAKSLPPGKIPWIVDAQNILCDSRAAELVAAGCKLAGVGKGHWKQQGYGRISRGEAA